MLDNTIQEGKMKYVCLIIALFVVSCQGQRRPPPPPPPAEQGVGEQPKPSPVVTLSQSPSDPRPETRPASQPGAAEQSQASGVPVNIQEFRTSQRPQGCSPGCYSDEICAEMGKSYCSRGRGRGCNVCIKMSSIRFPASALSGMFQQRAAPAAVPAAPAGPVVQPAVPSLVDQTAQTGQNAFGYSVLAPSSPFSYSTFTAPQASPLDQFSSYTTSRASRQEQTQQSYYPYYTQQQSQQQYNPLSNAFPFLFMGDFMGGLFGM